MSEIEPTFSPNIFIEARRDEYIRYVMIQDSQIIRRWEVFGTCRQLGDCLIGTLWEPPGGGDMVLIKNHEHIEQLKKEWGVTRLGSPLDIPILPEFRICCVAAGYLKTRELAI
jgi:hypothetical protein